MVGRGCQSFSEPWRRSAVQNRREPSHGLGGIGVASGCEEDAPRGWMKQLGEKPEIGGRQCSVPATPDAPARKMNRRRAGCPAHVPHHRTRGTEGRRRKTDSARLRWSAIFPAPRRGQAPTPTGMQEDDGRVGVLPRFRLALDQHRRLSSSSTRARVFAERAGVGDDCLGNPLMFPRAGRARDRAARNQVPKADSARPFKQVRGGAHCAAVDKRGRGPVDERRWALLLGCLNGDAQGRAAGPP